jgi:hypothetical protein
MKILCALAMAAALTFCFGSMGCETSHTETDKPALLGGTVHEETTTTHNPITNTDDKTSVETKTP